MGYLETGQICLSVSDCMQALTAHSMEDDGVKANSVKEGEGKRELFKLLRKDGTSNLDDCEE